MENKSKPESNENNYYNYVALFFWLYENTKINNKSLLKPIILKQEFLKAFPIYNINKGNEEYKDGRGGSESSYGSSV